MTQSNEASHLTDCKLYIRGIGQERLRKTIKLLYDCWIELLSDNLVGIVIVLRQVRLQRSELCRLLQHRITMLGENLLWSHRLCSDRWSQNFKPVGNQFHCFFFATANLAQQFGTFEKKSTNDSKCRASDVAVTALLWDASNRCLSLFNLSSLTSGIGSSLSSWQVDNMRNWLDWRFLRLSWLKLGQISRLTAYPKDWRVRRTLGGNEPTIMELWIQPV